MGERWKILQPGEQVVIQTGRPILRRDGFFRVITDVQPPPYGEYFFTSHALLNAGMPDEMLVGGGSDYPKDIIGIGPRWSEERMIRALRRGNFDTYYHEMDLQIQAYYRKAYHHRGRRVTARK